VLQILGYVQMTSPASFIQVPNHVCLADPCVEIASSQCMYVMVAGLQPYEWNTSFQGLY